MRYRLRTLLIVLALGPPLCAAGYWTWNERVPALRQWYRYGYVLPLNTPGYRWQKIRDWDWVEVPDEQAP